MKAQLLGLIGEVVGVHANAVPAHKAGTEGQEVPFAASGFKHFKSVDAQSAKDNGKLVHKGDVEVALGVFNHLGSLGHLDAGGPVDARRDHGTVDLHQQIGGGLVRAGNDLGDGFKGMHLVAGIDAFRRVADGEVLAKRKAGLALKDGHADFFGQAGIDGGFVHHHAAFAHMLTNGFACAHHGGEIRGAVVVNGRGHGHDDDGSFLEVGRVAGITHISCLQLDVVHFAGAVVSVLQFLDARGADVKTQHLHVARKGNGQGQTHIAKADDGQRFLALLQSLECHHNFIPLQNRLFSSPKKHGI